ncbi:Protein phosphatase 1 regulatory subunit 12B isoform 2 [Schistosoma japonicum]|uniref:Protein phosphatase 1 regulatory subunit 12B isoform 2 n=2 Tax=Schistosoma japonicum TaxID=6182 RepID=A0A4Z2DPY9_SCHJA|nr:Protein phosphatase 1 regulatory subunit 12B isoform 2 [Schistosoma japonicum]
MIQLKLSDSDICERRKAQLKEWCGSETDHASSKMREPDKIKFPLSVQLLAACSNSDLDEFSRLLKLGTDINTQNADGLTSTHLACINVDFDFLKFLISNGADINLQDHEGWTPLHAAASVGCCELARFLIENGADLSVLSVDLELPIDVAQDEEMINLLTDAMKKQNVDADAIKHSEEQMLLHDAQHWLTSGQYKPVVDSRTGATPLHVAACKDYTKAMEILLQIPGLDINAKDFDGWTALHAAAHWNREASARMLANAGASFDEHTRASQSVFDVADKEMIVLLRQLRERQRAERQSNSSKLSFESSKPAEAVKRSHPVELETENGNVSSDDDNSIIELDPSNCVNKKPTIEQDVCSPPTVSFSEQLIKTVSSAEDTALNTNSSSILHHEQTVILQSSASTATSISQLSNESSNQQLMTPLSSIQLEKTVPTKDTDDFLPNSTVNKPLVPSTKSVVTPSNDSPVFVTSTTSELSSVNESSSISCYNNKLKEQEILDNSLTKAFDYDMKTTSVSTLTQPTSALHQSSHSTLPVSLSGDISLSVSSSYVSSKPTGSENVTTDKKTRDDAYEYIANKPKPGIVSIIPVPRSKRSINENVSKDLLTSSTVVTTTATPPTTPATTTSGTAGRSITKIIAVKPRRNDSQKLNTDEKENALSLNNNTNISRDEIKASSPVPEVTTNRRISVVMAPTKSGETETQRSVKARYVRSTRRSTQGVSSEDVEQAKKLVDKSNSNTTVSNYGPMDSVPPVDLSSSSSDKTLPTDTPGVSNKPLKTNHTSSTWNRTILDNANPPSLRRFTDTDLLSSRINAENVACDTSRSSARADYITSGRDTGEAKLSNHFSASAGRHFIFSGETDMNSSAYDDVGNNNSSRRSTYGSRVRPVEHSPTFENKVDSTTVSGVIRERRHIRERNPPERVLSSKSFSSVSDVEHRLSDHNTGRSEYSPSSYINTNTIQSENDVKGIIQRPTSRFLHQTLLNNTSTNSCSPVTTSNTYSWNPAQIPPVYATNMNSSNNHNNNSNTDYSSLTNNTTPTPRDHVSQWQDSKDYKRLYEKEKEERERLQRELDRCNRQINQLRSEQQLVTTTTSFRTSNDYGYSNSDSLTNNYVSNNNNNSQIADTLQNRLQSYEDKMKEIVRLREEISKMKEENGALIRVISKLSKPI